MMPQAAAHILYIDDEVGLCTLAKRRLERQGYRVTVAHSGAQGVDLAREHDFDVVALDHYMPGQDGIETLARLMDLPRVPTVVYVTGSEETNIAVKALKAGASDYIVKNLNDDFFDLLGRTVSQALETRQITADKERAEQRLRETNAQLEAMLREMNHRVANSLQIVSALVKLQERRTSNAESQSIMRDIRQRIDAVSRVHQQLYVSGGGTVIDMAGYINGLVDNLAQTFASATAARPIRVTADSVEFPASEAISLGILINELVSNACKYAYADNQDGELRVNFSAPGGRAFRLTIADDGRGVDHDAAPAGTGLGTQIISAMASTLGASVEQANTAPGFCTTVSRASGP